MPDQEMSRILIDAAELQHVREISLAENNHTRCMEANP